MAIKTKYRNGGYSTTTANDYVNPSKPVYSLSTEVEEQRAFENGRPTSEIKAYKAWFSQEGLDPFQVKFEEKPELPSFMSIIEFDTLQACEIQYNVYFKANGIKEVK